MRLLKFNKIKKNHLSLALVILMVIFLNKSFVAAHTASTFVQHKWGGAGSTVCYTFTAGFPTGVYRDRVNDGAGRWNSTGMSKKPTNCTESDWANYDPFTCSTVGYLKGIHWQPLTNEESDPNSAARFADGTVAVTPQCYMNGSTFEQICDPKLNGQAMRSTQIVFNSKMRFWTSHTNTPADSNYVDLWSTATHEFGHFMGWCGHFRESDPNVCAEKGSSQYINRETMCPKIYPGTSVQRSPNTHDTHTMDAAY